MESLDFIIKVRGGAPSRAGARERPSLLELEHTGAKDRELQRTHANHGRCGTRP
jgi:hypothetical protein